MSEDVLNEDWDFDFSRYKQEETTEQVIDTINTPAPKVSGLRSRYSNFGIENEHLGMMKEKVLIYSAKTASGTQEMSDLWKHYGNLYTYWDCFKDIAGDVIQKEMKKIFKKCRLVLKKYQAHDGEIPYEKCHAWLLHLQSKIFRLRQLFNLGFDVEKTYRSEMAKSQSKIIEG